VEWISEEDWFFRLSAYRDRLIEHYERFPDWVQPRGVYNEMLAFLREGLDDLSVSRTNLEWGVPIPDGGVVYVWLDALLNYITAIGWGKDETRFHTYWPAALQLMAKDIARFHTIIWPAILWALGEAAPELVFAHGWITIDGQIMRKSLGNTIDPFLLAERFGADAIRYFLLREAPFGSDFSYSEEKIAQRHNSDLANDLGNLLQRTLAMLQRYRDGIVPEGGAPESQLARRFAPLPVVTRERFLDLRFREALEGIWELITALNQTIDERKPWTLHKENRTDELNAVLYDLCEGLRWIAVLLHPVMPERMSEMWEQLGAPGRIDEDWSSSLHKWGGLAPLTQTALAAPLFPKLDAVVTP
jgi:methionyl-tRNA synthetase